MQRTAQSEDDTSYVNHGVISNHANTRSSKFVSRITKATCRTDSPAVTVSPSCPEQEKLLPEEPTILSNAEMIRKNLTRDFPLHKPSVTLRPGSPAEKEKHRISNADRVVDLDELMEMKLLRVPERLGRVGEIRKSLSSTCVSSFPNSVSVQCQTTDDLVGGLLPPLRRRCVSKIRSKLERTQATEDITDPAIYSKNEVQIREQANKRQMACSEIPESFFSPSLCDSVHSSLISKTSPPECHICDNQGVFPLIDITTDELSQLDTCLEDRLYQLNGNHNISESHGHTQHNDNSFACNNSPTVSPLFLTANPQRTFKPGAFSGYNFEEIQNKCDNYNSQCRFTQCDALSIHLPSNSLKCDSPLSDQNASGTSQCPHSTMSSASLTHQESYTSSSVSIASSSSFTLPAFHSSTDSDPSQETFNDSLHSLELPHNHHGSQHNIYSYQEGRELTDSHRNVTSKLHSKGTVDSTSRKVVSFDASDNVADDVIEFHKYLQGHGVQIELSTVQSSDL